MSNINQLLSPQINKDRPVELLRLQTKKTSSTAYGAALNVKEESSVSISLEAKKMLEDKKEAEKREKLQDKLFGIREKSSSNLEELKAKEQETIARRVGELKQRLKALVEMMRQVLLFGDKRGAALIAKEAAQIAKELKALNAQYARSSSGSGGDVSIPDINFSGESGESAGSAESAESVQGAEEMSAEAEANAAQAGEREAQVAAAQAEKELKSIGETAESSEGETDEAKEDAKEKKVTEAVNSALSKAEEAIAKLQSNAAKNDSSKGIIDDEIKAMLRAIISMAKATIKQKTSAVGNDQSENPVTVSRLEKEVAKAEREVEEAITDMES